MTDKELLNELVKQNVIDKKAADQALAVARVGKKSAEEVLYERRLINEDVTANIKSKLTGAPVRSIDAATVPEDLFTLIPRETAMTYRVAPIERDGDMLVVGMLNPTDTRAQEALKFIAKQQGLSLGVYVVTPSDLAAVWRRYSSYKSEVESAVREIGEVASEEAKLVSLEEGGSSEEAPIIKIVASTLRQAVEEGASDIHIEPMRSNLRIRFRIDGDLRLVATLPIGLSQPIVSRIKVLSRLKLDQTRIPQDGRFRTAISDREVDYRVATFPTPAGEKVAIRVLDPKIGLRTFDNLGLNTYHKKTLDAAVARPYGMILISGPTGSGKTTTLYAIMQQLSNETVNVVSLEDPVEYTMEGINQSQVKPEIGYDFASGLRQILRQDPDVIMVGEIRDQETAGLAVNAALTGHVLLSTIHTNNAIGVIPRLIDLGVPAFLLSSSLNIMLAQRLVLRLCSSCKKETTASPEASAMIEKALSGLPDEVRKTVKATRPYKVFQAEPKSTCSECKGKGVSGRIAIYEIFTMTHELSELISKGFTEGLLIQESKRQGMVTLQQDGVLKALEGVISIEEVARETTDMIN